MDRPIISPIKIGRDPIFARSLHNHSQRNLFFHSYATSALPALSRRPALACPLSPPAFNRLLSRTQSPSLPPTRLIPFARYRVLNPARAPQLARARCTTARRILSTAPNHPHTFRRRPVPPLYLPIARAHLYAVLHRSGS